MFKIKSAKLIVFIFYCFMSVFLIETGKISGSEFLDFNKWLILFYFTANVTSKIFREYK